MSYSNRMFMCPYFHGDDPFRVYCDGATVKFVHKLARSNFYDRYCGNVKGWKNCTIAQMCEEVYKGEY